MRSCVPKMALVAAMLALGACQQPDVGQPCRIAWGTGDGASPYPQPSEIKADYFESGNTTCENLVCIMSPAPAASRYGTTAYCSKPCVSNEDCFQSKTGLVCRQMVLDDGFIAQLDPQIATRYLGEVRASWYCGIPE